MCHLSLNWAVCWHLFRTGKWDTLSKYRAWKWVRAFKIRTIPENLGLIVVLRLYQHNMIMTWFLKLLMSCISVTATHFKHKEFLWLLRSEMSNLNILCWMSETVFKAMYYESTEKHTALSFRIKDLLCLYYSVVITTETCLWL